MKKVLLGLGIVAMVGSVFALSVADLETQLNNIYNAWVKSGTVVYNQYQDKFSQLQTSLQTGDYKILTYFTGIDVSPVLQQIKDKYASYLKDITSKKYDIMTELTTTQTNFENWLITTGDYETALQNIAVDVSGYQSTVKNEVENLVSTFSGLYMNFENSLKEKLNYYSGDIAKYKDYKSKLEQLNADFSGLQAEYKKLEDVIWIAKNVILEKKDKLKEFVNQYYSGMLEQEFKKYLDEDPNFAYFESGFQIKKEVLLGFVDNQLEDSFKKILDSYYPDVDMDSLEKEIQDAKSKTPQEVVKNYESLLSWLNSLEDTIKEYKEKIYEKLNKFSSTDKEDVLKVIEKDLISVLDKATKLVQDDIKQTLEGWKAFIKTREEVEKPLMKILTDAYVKAIQENTIQAYENFLAILDSYKNTVILPQNKKILENYKNVVENNLKELKFKDFENQVNQLAIKLDKLPIWDFSGLNQIKEQVNQLLEEAKKLWVPEKIIETLKKLQLQVQLKENLNKLYECGAISFYYTYGDLTDTVADILMKYYEKYKAAGKEDVFMEKIKNAFKKLEILEQNLNNDLRSYYIIMIHNGLLKFKFELNND